MYWTRKESYILLIIHTLHCFLHNLHTLNLLKENTNKEIQSSSSKNLYTEYTFYSKFHNF